MLLGLLAILFVRGSKEKKDDLTEAKQTNIPEGKVKQPIEFIIPQNPLADAEEKLAEGDAGRFYKELDASLHKYLSQKLKVPAEELNRKKINERMDKYNVGVGTTLLVNDVLADIELNRYAPTSSESQMQEVYEKASEVVSLLDKQIS